MGKISAPVKFTLNAHGSTFLIAAPPLRAQNSESLLTFGRFMSLKHHRDSVIEMIKNIYLSQLETRFMIM